MKLPTSGLFCKDATHIMFLYMWKLMFTNYVINIYIKHTMLIYHNIHNNHIHKYTHIHIYTYLHIYSHTHIYIYIHGKDITLTHEIISTVITYIHFIM